MDYKDTEKLIAAGIVLFNPDIQRIYKSLDSLSKQINIVILYNNGADIKKLLLNKFNDKLKIIIIGNGSNVGIATALNEIMNVATQEHIHWVLTLDQDSIIPDNLFKEFNKHIFDEKLAIICPQTIDFRRKYMTIISTPNSEYIDMCITSGSYTNVNIWNKLNGFDDYLFIDLVDNDYCKRVRLSGYKILKLNKVILDHQYGSLQERHPLIQKISLWMGKTLHNTNISKLSFKRKVNPIRVYYENRNIIYLNKKYKAYGGIGYKNHHCKTYLGFFFTFSVYSLLVGDDKKGIFKAIKQGIKDGKQKKAEMWVVSKQ